MATNGTIDVRGELMRLRCRGEADGVSIDVRPVESGPVRHVMFNDTTSGRRIADCWPATGTVMAKGVRGTVADVWGALEVAVKLKAGADPADVLPADGTMPAAPTLPANGSPHAPNGSQGTKAPRVKKPRAKSRDTVSTGPLPLSLRDRRRLAAALLEAAIGGNLEAAKLLLEHARGAEERTVES